MRCDLNISNFQSLLKICSLLMFCSSLLLNCNSEDNKENEEIIDPEPEISFYKGADLSYVNEMEDCGALFKDLNNQLNDPFIIFKEAGANIVRVRLWHNPDWTNYSNFEDVKKTIMRAKALNLKVLLNFHYSDTWADPGAQQIPAAWIQHVNNTEILGSLLYNYTFNTLKDLANLNLLPDIVQVGNEINPMILQDGELEWPINWQRNAYLINQGIAAVRDLAAERNKPVEVMLHIAGPENGLWWFEQATQNGVTDFDWIGLSYYPIWSSFTLDNVGTAFSSLKNNYNKKLMVVETAYPFTLEDVDQANNILGPDTVLDGFPATEQGQLDYLNTLVTVIKNSGGEGLIYWEPAWISTNCSTPWGQGSHWDNATLFNHDNLPTLGMQFFNSNLNN
jgi:arabinogalactan endo-1,4-beta-galactosidase